MASADREPLWELRLEGSSPSAVLFSDPCPICGCRKRRCLVPPTGHRKKLLVASPDAHDRGSSTFRSCTFCNSPSPDTTRHPTAADKSPSSWLCGGGGSCSPLLGGFVVSPQQTANKNGGPDLRCSSPCLPPAKRGLFGAEKASPLQLSGDVGGRSEIAPMVPPPRKEAETGKGNCGGGASVAEGKGSEKSQFEEEDDVEDEGVVSDKEEEEDEEEEEEDGGAKKERKTSVFITCKCGTRHKVAF